MRRLMYIVGIMNNTRRKSIGIFLVICCVLALMFGCAPATSTKTFDKAETKKVPDADERTAPAFDKLIDELTILGIQ